MEGDATSELTNWQICSSNMAQFSISEGCLSSTTTEKKIIRAPESLRQDYALVSKKKTETRAE